MSNNSFFVDLPENCPPTAAQEEEIEVYRVVLNDPPLPSDFLPHTTLYPLIDFENVCNASSLSVFTSFDEILEKAPHQSKVKKVIKKGGEYYIAKGNIPKNSGKLLRENQDMTSNTHVSWWVYNGIQINSIFNVITTIKTNI